MDFKVFFDAGLTAVCAPVETLETRMAEIKPLPAALLRSAFSGHPAAV
jgi:hypothetical protein